MADEVRAAPSDRGIRVVGSPGWKQTRTNAAVHSP